jgi:hypothetical protein
LRRTFACCCRVPARPATRPGSGQAGDADAKAEAIRNADPDGIPDPDSATTTRFFKPRKVLSGGTVTVGGQKIDYTAEAGTVVVHQADWDDTDWRETAATGKAKDEAKDAPAEASMFYTAYFKKGAPRPTGRSPSCSTAAPVRPRSGCTWAPSARAG